jgi:ABC-type polysaccharide/polyol phosphate export permease
MIPIIKEIYSRRSLLAELIVKDLKVRYSIPALGFFWAFLSPFLMVVIFYIVFTQILKVRIEETPFLLYLMSAVFPWSFFQNSVLSSVASIVDSRNIIKEANFPQYLIPLSIVLGNAVIFLPSLIILIAVSAVILKGLPLFIVFLPFLFLLHLLITSCLSISFALLYVRWRDLKYLLEIILLLLLYMTPVFYSLSLIKASFTAAAFKVYMYNPFVGILNLYRITLLRGFNNALGQYCSWQELLLTPLLFTVVVLAASVFVYFRVKSKINDYLSY